MRWTDNTIKAATASRFPVPMDVEPAIDHVHRLLTDRTAKPEPLIWKRVQIERLLWLRWRVDHKLISEDRIPRGTEADQSHRHVQGC